MTEPITEIGSYISMKEKKIEINTIPLFNDIPTLSCNKTRHPSKLGTGCHNVIKTLLIQSGREEKQALYTLVKFVHAFIPVHGD